MNLFILVHIILDLIIEILLFVNLLLFFESFFKLTVLNLFVVHLILNRDFEVFGNNRLFDLVVNLLIIRRVLEIVKILDNGPALFISTRRPVGGEVH